MKLFAITFGDERGPSARMRLLQYAEYFKRSADELVWIPKAKFRPRHLSWAAKADVIINQECLLPTAIGWMLKALGRPIIFEWDDALYTRPGRPYWGFTQMRVLHRLHWWLKHADVVTVPSQYLAAYSRRYAKKVVIIPMAISAAQAVARKAPTSGPVLGWIASPASLPSIKGAQDFIGEFLNAHPDARLKIMCGARPELKIPFEYVPWEPAAEREFLESLDIGLLPMADEEFNRGKSPLKALQYASVGVPFVASRMGGAPAELYGEFAAVVVNEPADWRKALETLTDKKVYEELSLIGVERVRANHDLAAVFEKLHGVLEALASAAD